MSGGPWPTWLSWLKAFLLCCFSWAGWAWADGNNSAGLHWQEAEHNWTTGVEQTLGLWAFGASANTKLQFEASEQFEVRLGEGTAMKDERGLVFPCRLTPLASGNLTLPVAMIVDQGLRSKQRKVWVELPIRSDDMRLEVELENKNLVVGQWTELKVLWWSRLLLTDFKALKLNLPILGHPDIEVKVPFDAIQTSDKASVGLPVTGRRVIAHCEFKRVGEGAEYRVRFRLYIRALKAGRFDFGRSSLLVSHELVKRNKKNFRNSISRYPSYFNNQFFDGAAGSGRYRRLLVESEALDLEVKPLPQPEVPGSGAAMIDLESLVVSIEEKTLSNRSPLQVQFTFHHPRPDTLDLPKLSDLHLISELFEVPEDRAHPKYEQGKVSFSQSLWPKSRGVNAFPALSFSSYDSSESRYEVHRSEAFELEWAEVEETTASMGEFSEDVKLEAHHGDIQEGIWHSHWQDMKQAKVGFSSPLWWTLCLSLSSLLVLLACYPEMSSCLKTRLRLSPRYRWYRLRADLAAEGDLPGMAYTFWTQHLLWLRQLGPLDLKGLVNPLQIPVSDGARQELSTCLGELEAAAFGSGQSFPAVAEQLKLALRLQREWS
jgi:hypothetical protein